MHCNSYPFALDFFFLAIFIVAKYQCHYNSDKLKSGQLWWGKDKGTPPFWWSLIFILPHFLFCTTILENSLKFCKRMVLLITTRNMEVDHYKMHLLTVTFAKSFTQKLPICHYAALFTVIHRRLLKGVATDSRGQQVKSKMCLNSPVRLWTLISRCYLDIIQPSPDVIKIFVTTNKV